MVIADKELCVALETLKESAGWKFVVASLQESVNRASRAMCENPKDIWQHGVARGVLDQSVAVANLPDAEIQRIRDIETAKAQENEDALV